MMTLKINDTLKLTPIGFDYVSEVHNNFTMEIIQFLPIEHVSDNIEDTENFIKHSEDQMKQGADLVWVILNNSQFAGCCGIHGLPSKKPHFGLWIGKEQQSKGIGRKVVRFVLSWGIENLDVEYIKYPVDVRNTRSISLIKNLDLKLSDHYELGDKKKLKVDEYRIYKTS